MTRRPSTIEYFDAEEVEELLNALLVERGQREQQEEEKKATRVGGERRAAGPTGSTASGNEVDPTCEHGVAWDVHCCGCHSGFLFDSRQCVCF